MRSGCAFHPDHFRTVRPSFLVPRFPAPPLPVLNRALSHTRLIIHLTLSHSPFSRPETLRVFTRCTVCNDPFLTSYHTDHHPICFLKSLCPLIHGSSIRVSTWTPVRLSSPLRQPQFSVKPCFKPTLFDGTNPPGHPSVLSRVLYSANNSRFFVIRFYI